MASRKTLETSKSAERKYKAQLRKVAKIIGGIVDAHVVDGVIKDEYDLQVSLARYSKALGGWADSVTAKIFRTLDTTNKRSWVQLATNMSSNLKRTIATSDMGAVALKWQNDQVTLIKSLPIDAGRDAQRISQEAILNGDRAAVSAKKIGEVGDITANRATLIARTETAKANNALTTARALSVGADSYVWQTAEDADVRSTHAALQGNVYRFDSPPEIPDEGAHAPGDFPNCRCWAEPIV